jgi:hypothetical protein
VNCLWAQIGPEYPLRPSLPESCWKRWWERGWEVRSSDFKIANRPCMFMCIARGAINLGTLLLFSCALPLGLYKPSILHSCSRYDTYHSVFESFLCSCLPGGALRMTTAFSDPTRTAVIMPMPCFMYTLCWRLERLEQIYKRSVV